MAGKATLKELETAWSIDDVADANDILDAIQEAEARTSARARRK